MAMNCWGCKRILADADEVKGVKCQTSSVGRFVKIITSYLPNFRTSILLFLTSYFLLFTFHFSFAGGMVYWTPNGVQVTSRDGGIEGLADDMKGGAITFSFDGDSVYAFRVDRNGNLPWGLQGRAMDNYTGWQGQPIGVSDGRGGAIAIWRRAPSWIYYYQRVDSLGNRMWGANAQRVTLSDSAQWWPAIVSDGAKGIIVVWQEVRVIARGWDIYAQRIDSMGVRRWGDYGVAVCMADSAQESPIVTCDIYDNSVIAWADMRNGNYDVYVQRLNANGVPLWMINGVKICDTIGVQLPKDIDMATDTTIILVWNDGRNGSPNSDVYAQCIKSNGLQLWTPQGLSMCDTTNAQGGGQLIADSKGGAVIGWIDTRSGYKNIYAQRINSNGQKLWMNQGVAICTINSTCDYQKIVSDGKSGAIVCWQDNRSGNWDVYAQHVDSLGNILWNTNGMPVCTAVNNQDVPYMISSDSGRAIIVWDDYRIGGGTGYAQKIGDDIIGITEKMQDTNPGMQAVKLEIYPNPSSEKTSIRFTIHDTGCKMEKFSLKIYDISGRVVGDLTSNLESRIRNHVSSVTWDGEDNDGKQLSRGVYFCELIVGGQRLTKKMILLK